MSKKVDLNSAKTVAGSSYPPPYDVLRGTRPLPPGDAAAYAIRRIHGFLPVPGSSQRHWHSAEDEFIYLLRVNSCW